MSGPLVSLLALAVHVLVVLPGAVYVSTNRKPSSAITLVMAFIFIPVVGILFSC